MLFEDGVGKNEHTLPASTLAAAQIVELHGQHTSDRGIGDRTAFRQLLDEVRACPDALGADIANNYKLISVIAEAGLSHIFKDDPFVTSTNHNELGVACLDVIDVAINQNPDVLLYTGPEDDGDVLALSLWLIPIVISLLSGPSPGRSDSGDNIVSTRAQQLLEHMLVAGKRSSSLRNFSSVVKVYKAFAEGMARSVRWM